MNKKFTKALAVSVVTMASASAAVADMNWFFSPYVGVDAQLRRMPFKKGFGDNVAAKNYPQGNVYLGAKLCDWVGVELGYQSTTSKDRRAVLLGSATYFGQVLDPISPNGTNVFDTRTRVHGPHVNLVGFFPLNDCLELFGSVGVAQLKIKVTHNTMVIDGAPNANVEADRRIFAKRKLIPRATVGLQHMLTDCFGVRASLGWENTSRFRDIKPINAESVLVARVKDSFTLGLGLFYKF